MKSLELYDRLVNLTSAVSQPDLPGGVMRAKRQELDQIVNGPLRKFLPRSTISMAA